MYVLLIIAELFLKGLKSSSLSSWHFLQILQKKKKNGKDAKREKGKLERNAEWHLIIFLNEEKLE